MRLRGHATVIQIADDFIAAIRMKRDRRGFFIESSHLLPYQSTQHETETPSDSGESVDIEVTLRRLLDELRIDLNNITLILPTKRALFRDLIMPKMPPHVLDSAIALEIGESLPFPIDECLWGYRVIPHEDSKVRIVASILPKKPLMGILGAFKNLGIVVEQIYLSTHAAIVTSGASIGSMTSGYTIDEQKSTSICIIYKNNPILTRVIPKEANYYERLQQEIGLTRDYIKPTATPPDDFIHLQGVIRKDSIRLINRYDTPLNLERLSEAVISEVATSDADTYSKCVFPSDAHISSALIGGGLAELGYSDIPIDLASPHPPKESIRDKISRHLTYNVVSLILSIVILLTALSINIVRMNTELSSLNRLISKMEPYMQRTEALQLQSADLVSRIKDLEEEFKKNTLYLELLQEISSLLPEDTTLSAIQFEGDILRQLKGSGKSARAVLNALESSRYLENIRLLSPITPDKDGEGESFSISAVIRRSEVNEND